MSATTSAPAPQARKRRGSPAQIGDRSAIRNVMIGILWIVVALSILGLAWMVLQSFRSTRELLTEPWGFPVAPSDWHFENWKVALTEGNFGITTWNSIWVTFVSSVLTVVVAAPAAYYMGRVDNRLTRFLSSYFVLGLGIPAQVILIPLFQIFNTIQLQTDGRIQLLDSLIGLNLVYIGVSMPFTTFLLISFFRSIPYELEESAAIDGATPLQTMFKIVMPLARGGLMTAFILQVISHWNETLLALTMLSSPEKKTLPVALIDFVVGRQQGQSDWGGAFAGLCLVVMPMVIVYVIAGRKLSEGLTVGMGK